MNKAYFSYGTGGFYFDDVAMWKEDKDALGPWLVIDTYHASCFTIRGEHIELFRREYFSWLEARGIVDYGLGFWS